MKQYKLYIFDFDGTIFDTHDSLTNCYLKAFESIGIKLEEKDVSDFMKYSLKIAYNTYQSDDKNWPTFAINFGKAINSEETHKKVKIFPDTIPCFNHLIDKNIKFGIVSGNSRENISKILTLFDIDQEKIIDIVGFEEITKPKPDKQPLEIFITRNGFINDLKDVVYIGDAKQDFDCAHNMGVDVYIVDRNKKKHKENFMISTLMDLFK